MIEISRKKSEFIYRQNPWNPLIIDRRRNTHNARWQFFARRATPEDTVRYLFELERDNKAEATE
jgi:hypothetical protein